MSLFGLLLLVVHPETKVHPLALRVVEMEIALKEPTASRQGLLANVSGRIQFQLMEITNLPQANPRIFQSQSLIMEKISFGVES
jgi:hypothetical protein